MRRRVRTLPQYLAQVLLIAREFVKDVDESEADGPWFRGANDRAHGLLPGAYWRKNVNEPILTVEFMSQAPPYFDGYGAKGTMPDNLWDWYFLMQHYGLPTRLLDWTDNALVGLFFALQPRGPRPCVWVLDPAQLNKHTIDDPSVVAPGGKFSRHWLPMASDDQEIGCRMNRVSRFRYQRRTHTNRDPMAIFPARRNVRVLAQQGTFTVHGARPKRLDALVRVGSSPLACIDIDPKASHALLEELEFCGISEVRLFPELDKLAPFIKRRFELGQ